MMKVSQDNKKLLLKVLISIILIIAVLYLPYDYYTILRWIVCGISIYFAYDYYGNKQKGWTWIYIFIAILLNPIVPVN